MLWKLKDRNIFVLYYTLYVYIILLLKILITDVVTLSVRLLICDLQSPTKPNFGKKLAFLWQPHLCFFLSCSFCLLMFGSMSAAFKCCFRLSVLYFNTTFVLLLPLHYCNCLFYMKGKKLKWEDHWQLLLASFVCVNFPIC